MLGATISHNVLNFLSYNSMMVGHLDFDILDIMNYLSCLLHCVCQLLVLENVLFFVTWVPPMCLKAHVPCYLGCCGWNLENMP